MIKPQKIMAGRGGLGGDMLSALPIATYHKKLFPDAQVIWPINGECSQHAPLYLNNKSIDKIFIFDGKSGPESQRDWDMINSCQIRINPNPSHPDNEYPQKRNIRWETFLMGGMSTAEWESLTREEQRPTLEKWFKPEPRLFTDKYVSIFPQTNFSRENKRNPSKQWYEQLLVKLFELEIHIVQYGYEKDWAFFDDRDISEGFPSSYYYHLRNRLDYFSQVKECLSSDLVISTDSGAGLVMGAYSMNQLTLLTDHWGNTNNPYALAPDNPNNFNFFASGGCDNISIDAVVEKIKEKLNLT